VKPQPIPREEAEFTFFWPLHLQLVLALSGCRQMVYACRRHADTCDITTLDATEPVLLGQREAACAADSKRTGRISIFLHLRLQLVLALSKG
jgi:hypothetical protein